MGACCEQLPKLLNSPYVRRIIRGLGIERFLNRGVMMRLLKGELLP